MHAEIGIVTVYTPVGLPEHDTVSVAMAGKHEDADVIAALKEQYARTSSAFFFNEWLKDRAAGRSDGWTTTLVPMYANTNFNTQ